MILIVEVLQIEYLTFLAGQTPAAQQTIVTVCSRQIWTANRPVKRMHSVIL